jgi:putative transposase
MAEILLRCRVRYNTALEQRIDLFRQRGVTSAHYGQATERKDVRAELPEYTAVPSHIVQDVLARLDTTYQAFFRRVQTGQTPGFPRLQGRNR